MLHQEELQVVVQLGLLSEAIIAATLEVLAVEALLQFTVGVFQEVPHLMGHPNVYEEVEVSVIGFLMLENTGPPLLTVIGMVVVTGIAHITDFSGLSVIFKRHLFQTCLHFRYPSYRRYSDRSPRYRSPRRSPIRYVMTAYISFVFPY